MTILSLADTRFPIERANGLQTMSTCHALAERGHVVRLLVRPDTSRPARDPFAFYGVAPNDNLRIETVRAAGGARGRRAAFMFAAIRAANTSAADLIYTRDLGVAALLCRLPSSRRRRLVYESHGVASIVSDEMPRLLASAAPPTDAKRRRLDERERRVWETADSYITITSALSDDLTARYGWRHRVFVVPDGAREPSIAVVQPSPSDAPVAGYAGHLYPWKGVDIFVEALAHAPGIRGLIVGGHPGESDRARIESLAKEVGVADRLEITGLVPPTDVAARLAAATMLVLPNTPSVISERYTSPLKLFEYLWMNRPIVASDLPSIGEVLTHDVSGWLVQAGDARALASAMLHLARDPKRSTRLASAARALAPNFTWARRAERLEAAFTAALILDR